MYVDLINGMSSTEMFGMSKYRIEINNRLSGVQFQNIEYGSKSGIPGINKLYELMLYPYYVRRKAMHEHIQHITRQDLAFLRARIPFNKCVITCFDIIPIAYYHTDFNKHPIWHENVKGLQQANHIITISEFSKSDIVKHLNINPENIDVIPPAVDHKLYYKNRSTTILDKYGIKEDEIVVLYVGAEEPRKNVPMLIDAIHELQKSFDQKVKLLKVGKSNWHGLVRGRLLEQIEKLGMKDDVIFTGYLPESELPTLYNAADLFVFPSLYEGFGIPPLEAMACGTATVVANTSSLPEVVGDGAEIAEPTVEDITSCMYRVLRNDKYRNELIEKGIIQAKKFTWESSAEKTKAVYAKMDE